MKFVDESTNQQEIISVNENSFKPLDNSEKSTQQSELKENKSESSPAEQKSGESEDFQCSWVTPHRSGSGSWISGLWRIKDSIQGIKTGNDSESGSFTVEATESICNGINSYVVRALLRPDIEMDAIFRCFDQTSWEYGLLVQRPSKREAIAVCSTHGGKHISQVMSMQIGVSPDKLRCAIIVFPQAPGGVEEEIPDVCKALQNSFLKQKLSLSFINEENSQPADLDVEYVLDLLEVYTKEMMADLQKTAESLDSIAKEMELKGAGMMGLLKKSYDQAGLTIPRPTRSKPLSHYELQFPKQKSLTEYDEGTAAEILQTIKGTMESAKAKKRANEAAGRGNKISEMCEGVWHVLSQQCAAETRARIQRKSIQVSDRIENVTRHRNIMISTLIENELAHFSPINQEFHQLFKPLSDEMVIFNCNAMHRTKRGTLYLTSNNVCFSSKQWANVTQLVFPFNTIKSIKHEKLLGKGIGWALCLENKVGEWNSFVLPVLEPEYGSRVEDLVLFVFERFKKYYAGIETSSSDIAESGLLSTAQRIAQMATSLNLPLHNLDV